MENNLLKTRFRKLLNNTSNLREQVGSLYLLQFLPSSFLLLQFLIFYFSENLLCEEQTVFNDSFFFLSLSSSLRGSLGLLCLSFSSSSCTLRCWLLRSSFLWLCLYVPLPISSWCALLE